MWEALALLQTRKVPPAPGAANSSFKRASLREPLLFESDSWRLELSNLTGAIVGLRFKGRSSGGCRAAASACGGSSGGLPWWRRAAAALRLPGSWLGAARAGQAGRQAGTGSGTGLTAAGGSVGGSDSWASFNAPLALPVYSTYSEDDFETIFSQASRACIECTLSPSPVAGA